MNTSWFDDLARRQATNASRRQVLKRLAAGLLGLTVAGSATARASAQTCAGIQESCASIDCCSGLGCNEQQICIAAVECATIGGGCLTNEQCCQGLVCGDHKTCIAAAECSSLGQGCKADFQCCAGAGLACGADGTCVAASAKPGASGSSGGTATTLPSTGAGERHASDRRFAEGAVVAGVAALAGGALLRVRPMRAGGADADE